MKGEADHAEATRRFIELANQIKDEGNSIELVSAGLMTASGVYATYVAAGNDGGLNDSGVDKVANVYRANLMSIQKSKKAEQQKS